MREHVSALMIYSRPVPMEALKLALSRLNISPARARDCAEARHLIAVTEPHLIFTDDVLPDGSWKEILNAVQKADFPANLIVVGSFPNMKFYLEAIERGAFDFIMPPFDDDGLSHVIQCAVSDVMGRRRPWIGASA